LASGFAEAQFVVGNQSTHTQSRNNSNHTADWSHNHNAGSDGLLIVVTAVEQRKNVPWVKYNGISMTCVSNNYNDGKVKVAIWELENPPSGSHNIKLQ
jgi:hypothetical protein